MHVALVGAELEENLALRYLRAALEREGHRVTQLRFDNAAQTERVARRLVDAKPALVGFSLVFTARAREFVDLATRARQLGAEGFFVAGGHFASFNAEALLRDVPALDAVGLGEGERLLCALATALGSQRAGVPRNERLATVRGLLWRGADGADGALVQNPAAAKPDDLDTLAPPRRKRPFDDFHGLPVANVLSSRGCSHACAFCSIAAWHRLCGGARYRQRAIEPLADELADLYRQGVRIFNFHDDDFLSPDVEANLARLAALAEALEARGVGRRALAIKCRPDDVEPRVFARLVELGVFRVFVGIEAGSERALRDLGRGQRLADNVAALEQLNALGLHVCYNLLLFNPRSTLEDVAENVAFLRRHLANPINFCRTEIYSGTPLERQLRARGELLGDYWGYGYEIADPRAQRAFELSYAVFRERNFTLRGLHHRTMQLDYERQLAAHFFGLDAALQGEVRAFIRTVNENTCDHLERLLAIADEEIAAGHATIEGERLTRLCAAITADNRRHGATADVLLEAVRDVPRRQRQTSGPTRRWLAAAQPWVERAATAGLVASLALLPAACKKVGGGGTHATEMVALPLGDAALRAPLGRLLLPLLVEQLDTPRNVLVDVEIGADRRIARCTYRPEHTASDQAKPCPSVDFLAPSSTAGKRFTLRYNADELRKARRQRKPPMFSEMAPAPTPTPPASAPSATTKPVPAKAPPKKKRIKKPIKKRIKKRIKRRPPMFSEMAPAPLSTRRRDQG